MIDDGAVLSNTFGSEYRVLLFGAGPLSGYLATMALFSGLAVTVYNPPREEYRAARQVSGVALLNGMPDDVFRNFKANHRSCVIALRRHENGVAQLQPAQNQQCLRRRLQERHPTHQSQRPWVSQFHQLPGKDSVYLRQIGFWEWREEKITVELKKSQT